MQAHEAMKPSVWVRRFAPLIAAGGRVLDLACGSGRHTGLLAQLGYRVVALDRDAASLGRVQAQGQIEESTARDAVELKLADVEAGPWPFADAEFDGVVVTNYLHRPLFPRISASLRTGGVLIYETFAQGNERHGRPSNPDFLLAQDELLRAFAPALAVVAFEQGRVEVPATAVVQRICAVQTSNWGQARIPTGT